MLNTPKSLWRTGRYLGLYWSWRGQSLQCWRGSRSTWLQYFCPHSTLPQSVRRV